MRRITLFVFGGVAEMEQEPPDWRAELWMAIAGPVTSAVLGVLCALVAGFSIGPGGTELEEPAQLWASFGVGCDALVVAGARSISSSVFNLVPGFRSMAAACGALEWAASRDLRHATRWAPGVGQAFAGC